VNVLSLFSGIGGFELGLERAGMTVVGQVEIDPYCQRVLAKHWPEVPRHDDVRTAVEWWRGQPRPGVDVVCGGFPCQDISNAGKRAGIIEGERSSLWTFFAHAIRELRPRYALLENVAAILGRGLDVVAGDLAEVGYDLRWDCVPAAAFGAPHRRDRWLGIAYPNSQTVWVESVSEPGRGGAGIIGVDGQARYVADADCSRLEGPRFRWSAPECGGTWPTEPAVGRVADGVPNRVDRLRALGNAVVPQVAEYAGLLIIGHSKEMAA